jgi:hypothetical protein
MPIKETAMIDEKLFSRIADLLGARVIAIEEGQCTMDIDRELSELQKKIDTQRRLTAK